MTSLNLKQNGEIIMENKMGQLINRAVELTVEAVEKDFGRMEVTKLYKSGLEKYGKEYDILLPEEVFEYIKKPEVRLVGENGNIFNLLSIIRKEFIRRNELKIFEKLVEEVENSKSYDNAINVIREYVDIV